jgi:hypothetical protein
METGAVLGDGSAVNEDRFCVGCGYNVRTLKWNANCPECGRAVWDSVRKALHTANPDWLRAIQWGLVLLIGSDLFMGASFVMAHGSQGNRWVVFSYLLMPVGSKISLERLEYFNDDPVARWLFVLAILVQGLSLLLLSRGEKNETVSAIQTRLILRGLGLLIVACTLWIAVIPRGRFGEPQAFFAFLLDLVLIFITFKRLTNIAEFGEERKLAIWINWLGKSQLACLLVILIGLGEISIWMLAAFLMAAVDVVAIGVASWYLRTLIAAMQKRTR